MTSVLGTAAVKSIFLALIGSYSPLQPFFGISHNAPTKKEGLPPTEQHSFLRIEHSQRAFQFFESSRTNFVQRDSSNQTEYFMIVLSGGHRVTLQRIAARETDGFKVVLHSFVHL